MEELERNTIPCEDDEIDLIELWRTLKRHKLTIFITTLLFVALAVLYIIITKPEYKAVATLQIGGQLIQTGNGLVLKHFEDANKLKEYLYVKYVVSGKFRKKGVRSYIKDVSVPRKTKGFITITAYGPNNKKAIKTLKVALNDVISKHKAFYDNIIEQKELSISELKKQILHDNNVSLPLLKRDIYILQNVKIKKIDEKINILKNIDLKKIEERIRLAKEIEVPAILKKVDIAKQQLIAKQKALKQLSFSFKKIKKTSPTLAAITALQINTVQNDIKNLKQQVINLNLQIKKILEETIPDLEKQKQKILEETIPDLEKQKVQILKKQIPLKEAAIKQLLNITIPHLRDRIKHIQLTMQPPYLVMTKVVGKIFTHDYPVKPKKKLILIVALITGLILGVFLAFFVEFLQKAREAE